MTQDGSPTILMLAHDLSDAAVARRAAMLRAGGANVRLAGFRRAPEPIAAVAGIPASDLGRTYNAGFIRRIGAVLREVLRLRRRQGLFAGVDVILARNLEMLAIAARGQSLCDPKPPIVYECLDIHRLLVRRNFIGGLLRALEGWLAQRAALLLTSSPAFVENYFKPLSKVRLPVRLAENKLLDVDDVLPHVPARRPGPPWVIGWFGIIRCRKSLRLLSELARAGNGTVEVVIRGRPALDIFPDFERDIAGVPHLRFPGPYKNPGDLAAIYGGIHFNWAIDMFEEGLNSSWLLPNRLYEGGAFGAVPIAEASVETGRFAMHHKIGVTLAKPLAQSLAVFFAELTPAHFVLYEQALRAMPRETWVNDRGDCRALVACLNSLRGAKHG
ncbi:MAG TPA: glycosyl transferase family 1 [Alphaproteobacteria bacterium]|nr:glycosyl transferase family 1 [Alphaproteobacteria bacterium]